MPEIPQLTQKERAKRWREKFCWKPGDVEIVPSRPEDVARAKKKEEAKRQALIDELVKGGMSRATAEKRAVV